MTTLRGRLPILISECISRGIHINFGYHMGKPLIKWTGNTNGHHHFDNFVPGLHGANMLYIEEVLQNVIHEHDEAENA